MILRRAAVVFLLLGIFGCCFAFAEQFQVDKQKLKLSLESENFINEVGDEVRTPGIKATYLLRTHGDIGKKLLWNMDLQSGIKTNLDTNFDAGTLSRAAWSNRINLQGTVPVGRFYFGGSFYFRNKWLSNVDEADQFVDIFGGLGFRETTGTFMGGMTIGHNWDLAVSGQIADQIFDDFPLSDSHWRGASAKLTRRFDNFKLNGFFRARNVNFDRPVFATEPPFIMSLAQFGSTNLQRDLFREGGVGIEFSRPFYFAGSYSYQVNNSNNPGFTYRNHQVSLLIGSEISTDWYIQAFGIVQRYDFNEPDAFLPFPLLVGENDENNMAVSLVRTLGQSTELEFGVQRLTHKSSFAQLNAAKNIFYAAYNYRF